MPREMAEPSAHRTTSAPHRVAKNEGDATAKAATEDPRYDVNYLASHAYALFRTTPPVVMGALAGETQSSFTVDEAKALIATYRSRPVDHEDVS